MQLHINLETNTIGPETIFREEMARTIATLRIRLNEMARTNAEHAAELQRIRARLGDLSAQLGVELNAQMEMQSQNIAAQVAQLEEGGLPLTVQIHSLIDELLNPINVERNLAISRSLLDQIRNVRGRTDSTTDSTLQQQSTAFAVLKCVTTTILMLAFIVRFKSISH